MVSLKWHMVNYNYFTSQFEQYRITVRNGLWFISENATVIDCIYYHNSTDTSELNGKVSAERSLNNIIKNKEQYLKSLDRSLNNSNN
jgi:hypothetical protein